MKSSVELISEAYGTPSVRSKQTSAFFPHPQGFDSSDLTFPRIQWGGGLFFFFFNAGDISSLTCIKEEERKDKYDNLLLSKNVSAPQLFS